MAARENQGYLIAVIVLVLLSLVLALVAFLGVQKAYEQSEAAQAAEAKLGVSRKIADAEALKGEALKAIIGDLGTTPAEIGTTINDLVQISTDQSFSDSDKKVVEDIIKEVRTAQEIYKIEITGSIADGGETDAALATLRSRNTDLTTLVDRMRKDYDVQVRQTDETDRDSKEKIAQFGKDLLSAREELELVQKTRNEEKEAALVKQRTLTDQVEESKKAIADLTAKSDEAAQQAAAEIREARNQVAVLEVDNANLKATVNELTGRNYENADGSVIRVASALDTVFIDIGSAVGLTNNTTFSIYDQSTTNFETATPKASIEIVRVFPFRSEARITNETLTDPILRGDHILTPTWDPGFRLKFALAGRFDLDGDRFDDTDKLIQLIKKNGGDVIASHDEKGNVAGEITPEVRYLVKGNRALIDGEEGDADAGKILNVQNQMQADAEKNSVQVIDLQKLLNQLGVNAQPKTKQLDFPSGGFTPRQPTSSEGSSTRGSVSGEGLGSATR